MAFALALLSATTAHATDRFVSTKGDDGGGANACTVSTAPCATIGQALGQAADGDTIKIAKGTYQESLQISTAGTRTFQGGWDPTFATRDPVANKTTWKGAKDNRALDIEAFGVSITTIFDGMDVSHSKLPKGSFEPGAAIQGFSGDGSNPPHTMGALTLEIHNSTLKSDKSDAAGGAIELQQNDSSVMTLTITNTTFASNVAEFTGGAIDLLCTNQPGTLSVNISDSTFDSNKSTSGGSGVGGAVTLDTVCDNTTVTLTDDLFIGNTSNGKGTADSGGAGFRVTSEHGTPTVTFNNVVFEGNKSNASGGAVAAIGSLAGSVTLHSRNSTIAGKNSSKVAGGGVWLSGSVAADFVDDVIWGNTASKNGVGDDVATVGSPTVTVTSCDIHDEALSGTTSFTDGGGNIDADPLFAKGKFSPQVGSPLIDAGTCNAPSPPPVPSTDFFHHPRPDPAGPPKCDIGAVEF